MKYLKIGIVIAAVLILFTCAAGCVTSTKETPTATTKPTTVPTTVPKKTPTAVPTTVPKATPSNDKDVQAVVSGMQSKGYAVVTPVAYKGKDAYGDDQYTVTFSKGGYVFATTITKASSKSNADNDVYYYIMAAKTLGFSGDYTSLAGYTTSWEGYKYSGGPPVAYIVGELSVNNWIISMVTA